jgi:hypothetical protein
LRAFAPSRDREGQNDPISLLNAFHGFAYFFDDAHDFLANYGPFVERGSPSHMWRSLPQIPLVVTRKIASDGDLIFGFGWSATFIFLTP